MICWDDAGDDHVCECLQVVLGTGVGVEQTDGLGVIKCSARVEKAGAVLLVPGLC